MLRSKSGILFSTNIISAIMHHKLWGIETISFDFPFSIHKKNHFLVYFGGFLFIGYWLRTA